jgi:hypothetical protein
LQSALEERIRKAGYKPALRFGCGSTALYYYLCKSCFPAQTSGGTALAVAQISKPAVSPISKSAGRATALRLRVLKPAIQQTWESALLWLRLRRAVQYPG